MARWIEMMKSIPYIHYVILSFLLIAWCFIHSAMISVPVLTFFKRLLGSGFRYYRLIFNTISVMTFIPVLLYAYTLKTQTIFHWDGYLRVLQVLLLMISIVLFLLGGRHYDIRQFLGLNQIKVGKNDKALTDSGELDTSGILSVTRHPWYLAAILLIWARPLDLSGIHVNVLFTLYLIVGTYLEEKKIVLEYGEEYLNYQKKVSMLIPYKWFRSMILPAVTETNKR